ncbi:MAG: hypothetical protein A2X18_07610 [Bacteroidetes bacterium GWF2_40_14]|nr:MAG: hypothetical protein A2X18_07610 [Bacteroidetes bacterium GWF2_40_14]
MIIKVKPLTSCLGNLLSIIRIEREFIKEENTCFRSSKSDISKCLKSMASVGLYENNKLIGFVLAHFTEYGTGYIEKVFVVPELRNKGCMKQMMNESMSLLFKNGVKEVYTMVSPENEVSLKGFVDCGFWYSWGTVYNGKKRLVLKRIDNEACY